MLNNMKTNGMLVYSKWYGAMQAERLTAEGFAALRLVIRLAGLDKFVEPTGARILTRGATFFARLLWIGEDREVLRDLEHERYIQRTESQCQYTHHTSHMSCTIQYT